MSHSTDALKALRDAAAIDGTFPWPLVLLLTRAIVCGLLAIAVAVEECKEKAW